MMTRLSKLQFLLISLTSTLCAQIVPITYDFDSYQNNSDTAGYEGSGHWTGSNGWSTTTHGGSLFISATDSHDGSNYIRFTDSGSGVGGTAFIENTFGTLRTDERFSFSFSYLDSNHWGTSVGFGSQSRAGVALTASASSGLSLTLNGASVGSFASNYSGPESWHDFRVDLDLGANGGSGLASVFSRITGESAWAPVTDMADLNLGLDVTRTAADSANPLNWDTLWFHHEGATSGIDNISVSAIPEPSTYAALFGAAVFGVALWVRRKR